MEDEGKDEKLIVLIIIKVRAMDWREVELFLDLLIANSKGGIK